ncbi:exodeoxyribonuclease V subunit alpha [Alysiella sp.]|uniref:exodeoxyribonuclease V subunit alpha n=1 Tax=Alysiella sp. TaxID=1872483 RepID=UPI0026DD99FA|nr:exodeoxyribonuclease V subunit alpha [Alysiella sp.]
MTPHPAAQATYRLLCQTVPEWADTLQPFVERLFQAYDDGHSFIWLNQSEAENLAQAHTVVGINGSTPLTLLGRQLFFSRFCVLEQELAAHIRRLSNSICTEPRTQTTAKLREWFADSGSYDQQNAAALALIQPFVLISGGPGTGKTTTVAKLLALLCLNNDRLPEILLAAPTGKAAARMSEALHAATQKIQGLPENVHHHLLGLTGQTVHRLLNLRPPQMQAQFDEHHPLTADVLLLDEASMLDTYLLKQLLAALPNGCRVVLLGDAEQLPSVGAGAILDALTQTPVLSPDKQALIHAMLPEKSLHNLFENHAKLTISHRFHSQSGIGNLARAIQAGDAQSAWETFAQYPQALSQYNKQHSQLVSQLYQTQSTYWQAIDQQDIQAAFEHMSDMIVLTAVRADAENLNQQYCRLLQQHGRIAPHQKLFPGQVIMITRNDHAQRRYNGDMGIIMAQPDGRFVAHFADGQILPASKLPEHETAFAITVHKSQGSEYREVWFVAPERTNQDATLAFSRTLLYTAVTRAKQRFVYWGKAEDFQAACTHIETRRSALAQFLATSNPF